MRSKWTRSSRSEPDPLDPGRAGYAHRGLHQGLGAPENSLKAFAAALDIGAGIECDIRLTADDRIVVFHDSDTLRLCGSSRRISQSTLDELSRLRVGDEPIPTLADLFDLVAGRAPILIEVKVERDILRWLAPLQRALAEYTGPFGVMSFDPCISRLLKSCLPQVRRGLVVRDRLASAARGVAIAVADPHFMSVETTAITKPWVARARQRTPIYCWTVRTAEQRAQAAVHADALIWEADGRPRI